MQTKYRIIEGVIISFAVIITLIAVVAVALGMRSVRRGYANMRVDARSTDETAADESTDISQRNIFFAGIEDTSIRKGMRIALENLEQNGDFLMKYSIFDTTTDTLVFETDLIPSGEHVDWDPSVSFSEGKHTVAFVEEPFWEKDGEFVPLTSGRNIVNIEVLPD